MIDTHIHLYDERYNDIVDDIINEAKIAGVKHIIIVACGINAAKKAIVLKREYGSFISLSFGFHPVDAAGITEDDINELRTIISNNNPVAIGEIGLDYHWHPEQKLQQIKILEAQLKLAEEFNLPVIIHNRDASQDIYDILKLWDVSGVIHSFSDGANYAKKFINLGYKLGISGPITFKNGYSQKETVREIGLENIVLETDGPYLTPVPYRGKLNKPHFIEYIAAEIAFQKQMSLDEVKQVTTKSAIELFGIDLNV